MGVKELWAILTPVCERKTLWDLQNKTIAIDLSAWVCDSQKIIDPNIQPRFYLRNLFFRTNCLLFLGVKPIFVLEGTAPALKIDTINKRKKRMGFSQKDGNCKENNDLHQLRQRKRTRLQSLLKQCAELLEIMGISCVISPGEGEALCAKMDKLGLVNGCISQDGDCFLYGAETVYRNFSISSSSDGNSGFSIDVYTMENIRKKLELSRTKMVALSLICGCDYSEGVHGIGKESALKFLNTLTDDQIIERLKDWRENSHFEELEKEKTILKNGGCEDCGHSGKHKKRGCSECGLKQGCIKDYNLKLPQMSPESRKTIINELNIRSKALNDENFPSQEVIDEYLNNDLEKEEDFQLDFFWKQPQIINFMKFAAKLLNWTESYSIEKIFPLLARWQVVNKNSTHERCLFSPKEIIKKRVVKAIPSYEVRWNDDQGLLSCIELEDHISRSPDDEEIEKKSVLDLLVTTEPQDIFEEAFPEIVKGFLKSKQDEANAKKEIRKKSRKRKKNDKSVTEQEILDLSDMMENLDMRKKNKNCKKIVSKEKTEQVTIKSIFEKMKCNDFLSQQQKAQQMDLETKPSTSCHEEIEMGYESFEWSSNDESEFSDISLIIDGIVSRKEINLDQKDLIRLTNKNDNENNPIKRNARLRSDSSTNSDEKAEVFCSSFSSKSRDEGNDDENSDENDNYVPLFERLKKNHLNL